MAKDVKTVVVTGGAHGIGAAVARQYAARGAQVAVLDLAPSGATPVGGVYIRCDVADEIALGAALQSVEDQLGPIDIYVSNAGVMADQPAGAVSASNADWARCWSVNVMAHVYAARVLLPAMARRRSGHFVIVASAAGLLNQIGDAAYSATKHAAVSLAESLAITHADDGLSVSLVCPQYVATSLIGLAEDASDDSAQLLSANEVAMCIQEGVEAQQFLILPHHQVATFAQARATDHEKWIRGMTDLRRRAIAQFGDARPERIYRLL